MTDESDVEKAWNALGELQAIDADGYSGRITTLHDEVVEAVEDLAVELELHHEDD